MIAIDVTEAGLDAVAADLGRASFTAVGKIVATTTRAAGNIQRQSRELISGLPHAPHYPQSITFDVEFFAGAVVAEVGPDKDLPQGALGNLLEYGSANNPPLAHLGPSFDREVPEWLTFLGEAITPW